MLAAGALALLAGLSLFVALRQPVAAGTSLAEARRLWAANEMNTYRLHITQETRMGRCEQEIVTRDGRAETLSNTCGMPASWTVPRLFSWIEELERDTANCYPDPSMCACRSAMTTAVHYDETMGYPREVVYEWHKQPNLPNPAYWRSLLDRSFPGCDKDGRGGPVIFAISLTEEPR